MKRLQDYFFDDLVGWLDTKPFHVMLWTLIVPGVLISFGALALWAHTFGDDHGRDAKNVKVERVHTSAPFKPTCSDLKRIAENLEDIINADRKSAPTTTTLVPTTTTLECQN